MMGGGQEELQQLSQEIEAIEQEISAVEADIQEYRDEKAAISDAIEALDTLETDSTVQVPLGGGAYIRAQIEEIDEVIVDLGADYAAEQDEAGAVKALETKRELIDDRITETGEELEELREESQELEQQAQQMQQQMQQQQMQQMQQMQGEQPDE